MPVAVTSTVAGVISRFIVPVSPDAYHYWDHYARSQAGRRSVRCVFAEICCYESRVRTLAVAALIAAVMDVLAGSW